jgi:hypothetical protein
MEAALARFGDLPRLETLDEVLNGRVEPPVRKRRLSVVHRSGSEVELRLGLRRLLKDLFDDAPRVLKGPLEQAMADIDGCDLEPEVWVPKKKPRDTSNRQFEAIPEEDQKELQDLESLYVLVKDMWHSAAKEQKEILETLRSDIDRLIVTRRVGWLCQFKA